MLHLEFPPEFVHVAFTQLYGNSQSQQDIVSDFEGATDIVSTGSKFAVMGEYGNNINVYDSNSFIVCH